MLIEYKPVNTVAREYRVTNSCITNLIMKSKKNPKFIAELFDKPNMETLKFDIIMKTVNKLYEENAFIDNCE